jgi:hypothetical protein
MIFREIHIDPSTATPAADATLKCVILQSVLSWKPGVILYELGCSCGLFFCNSSVGPQPWHGNIDKLLSVKINSDPLVITLVLQVVWNN